MALTERSSTLRFAHHRRTPATRICRAHAELGIRECPPGYPLRSKKSFSTKLLLVQGWDELTGRTFGEACFLFADAVPLGIRRVSNGMQVELNPDDATVGSKGCVALWQQHFFLIFKNFIVHIRTALSLCIQEVM